MQNNPRESKKIISRLVLQKIISSEASRYMDKMTHEKLSKDFLSSDPEKDKRFSLFIDPEKTTYSGEVCTLELRWRDIEGEVVDPEGNVWTSHSLNFVTSLASCWNVSVETFNKRVQIMNLLSSLVEEISSILSGPIQVLSFNNEERIVRDEKRTKEKYCKNLYEFFFYEQKKFIRGLRVNGRSREFSTHLQIPAGTYQIFREEGSRRNPIYKTYEATFYSTSRPPTVRRIS